jgi:putative endonuclease
MNTYYIYILLCSDNSYYIGFTNNIQVRFEQHQNGFYSKSYTYNKRPIHLIYREEFLDIKQAIEREKQLKKWSRAKKEALVKNDMQGLINLSKGEN